MKTEHRPLVVSAPADHIHDESQPHTHETPRTERRLQLALGLTVLILAVELVGGLMANSLALIADAGHMLTDVFALALTWFALVQSRRPADARRTFGYHRVGILAALLNATSLLPISVFLIWEALGRLAEPPHVDGGLMFGVAAVGLIANAIIGLSLHGAADENLNIRSAVIHVMGDAAAAGSVLIGAVVISMTGWGQVDPLLSIAIALLVAVSGWRIVRDTVRILLESAPKDVDAVAVAAAMRTVPGVRDVHDLHIWQIAQGINALSCHVLLDDQLVSRSTAILVQLNALLEQDFHIGHSTIQPECAGCDPNSLYCSMTPLGTPGAHNHAHAD
jgi:cobalt-zinc-cadmium efflux system protein